MEISISQTISHPRQAVYEAFRDRLCELSSYLPNVASIERLEEEQGDGGDVRFVHKWTAAPTEIPSMARPFIDASKVSWLDHAKWKAKDFCCDWSMEPSVFTSRVRCEGTNSFVAEGEGATLIRIEGVMEVNLKGALPRLVAGRAAPAVETFVIRLIKPNLEQVAGAVARLLDDDAS
jgi:hypothetical protein